MLRVPVVREPNTIPPITDPLGKHWNQPDVSQFLIDDENALMSQQAFDGLANYSASFPSGVYPGKCWKRHCDNGWWLIWYDHSEKGPGWCSNCWRKIIIA